MNIVLKLLHFVVVSSYSVFMQRDGTMASGSSKQLNTVLLLTVRDESENQFQSFFAFNFTGIDAIY